MKHISSRDNARYKHLRALNEDARYRRESAASLIDGDHLLCAALDSGVSPRQLVLREDVVDSPVARDLVKRAVARGVEPAEILVLSAPLFKTLSPVMTPSGFLAEIAVPVPGAICAEDCDVLALAGVQDTGNLGTLLRTAAAAGISQVWLDRQTTQAWSPKALRAGMGAQFLLSIVESCDLAVMLAGRQQRSYVTHLGAQSAPLYDQNLREPAIWVFGAEGQGVPAEIVAMASHQVRIPMPGGIESLNVAAAAAICLFEQVRQRQLLSL